MDKSGLFQHVNDTIRELATDDQISEDWGFICECSDVACHVLVSITLVEFDERRAASPPIAILAAEHGA